METGLKATITAAVAYTGIAAAALAQDGDLQPTAEDVATVRLWQTYNDCTSAKWTLYAAERERLHGVAKAMADAATEAEKARLYAERGKSLTTTEADAVLRTVDELNRSLNDNFDFAMGQASPIMQENQHATCARQFGLTPIQILARTDMLFQKYGGQRAADLFNHRLPLP